MNLDNRLLEPAVFLLGILRALAGISEEYAVERTATEEIRQSEHTLSVLQDGFAQAG